MKEWTIEKLRNNDELKKCSNFGCSYILMDFENKRTSARVRGFKIYKIVSGDQFAYVMVLNEGMDIQSPPILLSEEATLFMLNNPKSARMFAMRTSMQRNK